jgi:PAS domain S-box-containing protein
MRNECYRVIVETASEGIWTIDEKNLTTLANPALAEMLGYEPREMLGKSVFDFMAPAFVERARRSLELRREGIHEWLEFPFRTKDGHEVWTLIATSSLHDRNGEYVGAGDGHRHHRAEGGPRTAPLPTQQQAARFGDACSGRRAAASRELLGKCLLRHALATTSPTVTLLSVTVGFPPIPSLIRSDAARAASSDSRR